MSNKVRTIQQTNSSFLQEVAIAQTSIAANRLSVPIIRRSTILPNTIPSFGHYGMGSTNPSDKVLLDIFSFNGLYLDSNYSIEQYSRIDSDTVEFDVIKDLEDLEYVNGKFKVEYRFLRNLLGSGDGEKLGIVEISSDRLEARVLPVTSGTKNYLNFKEFFQKNFFKLNKKESLPALKLYLDSQRSYDVFDYVQDKITYPFAPYSIILKFNNPLPNNVQVGGVCFLAQEISDSNLEEVLVLPKTTQTQTIELRGPNFDAVDDYKSHIATPFKNYAELTGSGTIAQSMVTITQSGSLLEGVDLNIDYRDYSNFIHFGSAYERLANFELKVRQLENYIAIQAQLTTGLTGLASGSVSSSVQFLSNLSINQNKINATLGGFDGYEKFLYYSSASYETSSFGEFYSATWPKSTTTKPYNLYSFSSSEAENWLEGAYASASLYDENNDHSLRRTIPEHIQEDAANNQYVLFVNMIGHYFDFMYAYIKQLTLTSDRQELISEGFAKDIIYNMGESLGISFDSGVKLNDLWNYALGVDITGSYVYTNQGTLQEKQQETWKRIINNLPYLLKTKGTERGLRALINIFGIPSTMLRVREYGGPEATYESVSDYTYDRFFYALNIGLQSSAALLYGSGLYGIGTYGAYPTQVAIPWITLDQSGTVPYSTELRFRAESGSNRSQIVFDKPNDFAVKLDYTNYTSSIQFTLSGSYGWATASVEAPIFDGNFWNMLVRRVPSPTIANLTEYQLVIKQVRYNKITQAYSASLLVDVPNSASYNQAYDNLGTIYLGSFDSSSFFSGSVQEFRYWSTALQDTAYDQHTLAPTSFVGNVYNSTTLNTSSYYELGARFCFGSDNKRQDIFLTASYASQHPNQLTNTTLTATLLYYASGSNLSSSYSPIHESHTLYWPDLSGNRQISNKIRLQDNTLLKPQLDRNVKLEVASNENYPIDSPKLGLYLSPQDEVNQDIAEQFGSLNIDNLIGSPSNLLLDNYPELNIIQTEYSKKYSGRNSMADFINRVKQIDDTVFRLAKQLVPFRANMLTGVVIEPTILQRAKFPFALMSYVDWTFTSSIDMTSIASVTASVADMTGQSVAENYYMFDTTVSTPVVTLSSSLETITGSVNINVVSMSMFLNELGNEQTYTALVDGTFPDGVVDVYNDQQASQYTFIETVLSGSTWTSSLNPYWRREPLQPIIWDARYSEIFNTTNDGVDIFQGSGSMSIYPTASNGGFPAPIDSNPIVTSFGARFYQQDDNGSSTAAGQWTLNGTYLDFFAFINGPIGYTGSAFFLAFPTASIASTTYDIYLKSDLGWANANTALIAIAANQLTPFTIGSQVLSSNIMSATEQVFSNVIPQGPYIQLLFTAPGSTDPLAGIKYIKVIPHGEKARVQDYNFLYEGRVRQIYKGTQQTSQDYNINSDDTIDKGPVISVVEVNPNTLRANSATNLGNTNLDVG